MYVQTLHFQANGNTADIFRPQGRQFGKTRGLPWTVTTLEHDTPPAQFTRISEPTNSKSLLAGVKVLEMCRVIAGPSICRILTEYGADVLKVTSPNLSDVPFFQVEGYNSTLPLFLPANNL
jgi:hypothetical protein